VLFRSGSAAQRLQAAYEFYGVRVCGEWSYRMLLDDPRALELFWKAGDLHMPVVLHLDVPFLPNPDGGRARYQTNWYGGGAPPLERTLRECPDTVFVGHAPGFWRFLSGDEATQSETYPKGPITPGGEVIRLLDTYANLWADLSAGSGLGAMQRDEAQARRFIETYQDRLLFGRDAPGDALRAWLLGMGLDEAVLRKLFHENAERLVPV
jgi:predicted TIM-barrel fold metal-dependent hydrolase